MNVDDRDEGSRAKHSFLFMHCYEQPELSGRNNFNR